MEFYNSENVKWHCHQRPSALRWAGLTGSSADTKLIRIIADEINN
jgi:hypothetical protein